MTNPPATLLPLRHISAAVGGLALLVGFGQTWSTLTLTTGQTVAVSGTEQAPLALSLMLVVAAAHLLSLLVYRAAHLTTVIVQTLGSVGAGVALWGAVANPVGAASSRISQLTGLSGQQTIDALVDAVTVNTVAVGVSVTGVVAFVIASVLGLLVWREQPESASRFDRHPGNVTQHPWDELSDGGDPTDR